MADSKGRGVGGGRPSPIGLKFVSVSRFFRTCSLCAFATNDDRADTLFYAPRPLPVSKFLDSELAAQV